MHAGGARGSMQVVTATGQGGGAACQEGRAVSAAGEGGASACSRHSRGARGVAGMQVACRWGAPGLICGLEASKPQEQVRAFPVIWGLRRSNFWRGPD